MGDRKIELESVEDAVRKVWINCFTPNYIVDLTRMLVCKLMIMTRELLMEWESDPEALFLLEGQLAVSDHLSIAAQHLYLSLIESNSGKSIIPQLMASLIKDYESQSFAISCEAMNKVLPNGGAVHETVLLWDAIYTAVGISVNNLSSHVDLSDWFRNCLSPALSSLLSNQCNMQSIPVLKRRIIWLIGCCSNFIWVTETSHTVLLTCLTTSTDLCVQLTAIQSLTCIMYEPGFDQKLILSSIIPVIETLYHLLATCNELESHQTVTSTIILVLSLFDEGSLSDEAANQALLPLKVIWDSKDHQNILRKDVICILKHIVVGVGSDRSKLMFETVAPILHFSLRPENEGECMYLVEDALSLWLIILRLSKEYVSILDDLFPSILGIIQRDFEHLRLVI